MNKMDDRDFRMATTVTLGVRDYVSSKRRGARVVMPWASITLSVVGCQRNYPPTGTSPERVETRWIPGGKYGPQIQSPVYPLAGVAVRELNRQSKSEPYT
jgi:hypothetical protein